MNPAEVFESLSDIAASPDFISQAATLTDKWSQAPDGFGAVEPILRFMAANPSLDFGMPGPLVHFVEQFYGEGYEGKLLDSVNQKPTLHTVWMLNRVINGTKDQNQKRLFAATLSQAANNPVTDPKTRQEASRLLARLSALNE